MKSLSDHEDIEQFIAAPRLYYQSPNYGWRHHDNAALQKSMASGKSYTERVRSIEHKGDAHKRDSYRRIAHLKNEIKAIRTSKFNVLLRSSTQEVEGLFENLGQSGQLARFLILEGYLDDSYYQYTSLFHSGRLSPNDNKFLIQIRAFNTPEPLFPIDNPSEVIAGMREDDFGVDYALNVRIVDALLEDEKHRERLGKVIAYLSNEFPNQQKFFEAYYTTGSHVGEFLRQLVDTWRGFVPAAIEGSSAALHIARFIEHICPHMLARERKEHPEIQTFVADNLREILDLLEGLDPDKLEELQIETKDLAAIDGYPNIARKLYDLGHYRLNDTNFDYIFGSILGKEAGPALRKRHYSAVRNSGAEPLLARVESDFEAYFVNVLQDMADDDEEEIDAILAVMSHDTLDAAKIETFVIRQTKLLPTLENVPERYQAMVFREARIVPTWSNCLDFIQSVTFDNAALIAFLADDEVRAGLLEIPLREVKETLPLRQFLINAGDLGDEAYLAYVKALPGEFKKFPEVISARKRQILIDERRVTFDGQNLAALNGEVDLQTMFVARNIASYLRDPSSFWVDDNFRERLLAADISDSERREIIDLMELSALSSLPERAGIIGPILSRTNVELPSLAPDIVKAIIVNTKPVGTQIRLINLLHERLDKNEIREVLGQLPDPYSKIQTGYARPALQRTNENSELARWLDERDIISSVGKSLWSNDIMVNLYRS